MWTMLNFHFTYTHARKPIHNLNKVRGCQEIKVGIEALMQAIGHLVCVVARIKVGQQRSIVTSPDICEAGQLVGKALGLIK